MGRTVFVVFLLNGVQALGASTNARTEERAGIVGVRDPAIDPTGRFLAFTWAGKIMALDLGSGRARSVAPGIGSRQQGPAWSADGREIAFSALHEGSYRIFAAGATGRARARAVTTEELPGDHLSPTWAGSEIVFVVENAPTGHSDLYAISEKGGAPRRLTENQGRDLMPVSSPDGREIAYVSDRSGEMEIWTIPTAGGDARRLTFHEGEDLYPAWSPDGERIVFSTESAGERQIAVVGARGGIPVPVSASGGQPTWSKDGKWIYFAKLPPLPPSYNGNPLRFSDREREPLFFRDGAYELYRVPAPAPLDAALPVPVAPLETREERNLRVFDRVVADLRGLYYRNRPGEADWQALTRKLRPEAMRASSEDALEDAVDRLLEARPLIKEEAHSRKAVVVSAHPLATEAGLEVLRRGGNVIDAAVAVSFTLGVVEPDASGIGGEGMMLAYLNRVGRPIAIDFKDQAPLHATPDNPQVRSADGLASHGPAAANIPGVVAGMDYALRKYGSGKVSWAELIAPAIHAAEEGFTLDEALPSSLAEGERYLRQYKAAARIFLPDGKPLRPGDRFVNRDYASTLKAIAEGGADAFYRGKIAKAIAADMRANGGIIAEADLGQYRAIEREPLVGTYRGLEVVTAPPPVSAGASLLQMLSILDQYPLGSEAHYRTSADTFHYMVEAWRGVTSGRLVADPFFWDVNLDEVLSSESARKRFAAIKRDQASPEPDLPEDDEEEAEYTRDRIGTGTTAAVVADAEGNLVALTQTLSTWGGNFYVSEGLGFLYNNHLRGYRRRPGFGALTPLARSSTGICPTLVLRKEGNVRKPFLTVAAAGNAWITSAVYQILTGIIDFGLSPQKAVEAPRFLVARKQFPARLPPVPGRVLFEDGISRRVVNEMERRGHRLEPVGAKGELVMGYASVAVFDEKSGEVRGGADPRRAHRAGAVEEKQ